MLTILTLVCSQSDSCQNHICILPAFVKDFLKNGSDKIPSGTAVKFHRTYYTVISGCHFRPGITTVMIRVVPLGGQFADGPFGKVVVYR